MRSAAQRLGLFVGCTLLAVVLSELSLRLLTPATFLQEKEEGSNEWQVYDPVLSWTNKAGYREGDVQINSLHFRGEEVLPAKPGGMLRIVCMGDSGTFGIWKEGPQEVGLDSYPEELRKLLHGKKTQVEIINSGVVGYSSSHGVRQLMTQVLSLEPDIVTVRYGANDHQWANRPSLLTEEPSSRTGRFLLYRFHTWRLVRLGMSVYQRLRFFHLAPNTVRWAEPMRFEANLQRFVEISRERGFRLLFLDYPIGGLESDPPAGEESHQASPELRGFRELRQIHQAYQAIVRRIVQKENVPLVNTTEYFQKRSRIFPFTDYDIVHPNHEGMRLIAQALLDKFEELGWL